MSNGGAMETGSPVTFGNWLKRFRMAAGLTQEALAERAGLSVRGISDLERGRRSSPYYETIRMLADALGLGDDDRAVLIAAARARDGASALAASIDPPTNLPTPVTSCIGREHDSAAICALLGRTDIRLVTLTGPGGIGKTRLALKVAAELRSQFADGVFFVPLAALRDPGLVLATVVHILGLQETGDTPPLARLIAHVREKHLLLVLDNYEHVLAAAPAVSELLAACPGLKVLTTSRALLHLSGEHEYAVSPLALPDPHTAPEIERLSHVPAVALLLARLSAIAPWFVPTAQDAPAIAEICMRSDGLPLAIELAAARGKHLTVQELAARLQGRLRLLTSGPRDLPARQQTLRDTIAWSYDLLSADMQRLFRWLSVFGGGWTMESAEALCAETDDLPGDVADGLAALVDSSLVRIDGRDDGRTRYGMLETIREFAAERLAASGEEETVRRRHAEVMHAWSVRCDRGLESAARTVWAHIAPAELDNIRAALRWSLDRDETERALQIVGNLVWFWDVTGREREGWEWSKAALAKENADRAGWGYARALYATGELAWNASDFAMSSQLLTESVTRFRTLDDRRSLGEALVYLGMTRFAQGDGETGYEYIRESVALLQAMEESWSLGLAHFVLGDVLLGRDPDAARVSYERSLAIYRALGDPWGIAAATTGLGGLAMRERDYAAARALMEEGLALRSSANHPLMTAISLASLGELARREGDDIRAMAHLADALARFREHGDRERMAWALYNLGMVALHRGNAAAAASAFEECLTLRAEQENRAQIAQAIAGFVHVAVLCGDPERAARLWGAVEAIRDAHGIPAPTDEDGDAERAMVCHIRAALGGDRATALYKAGRTLTQEDVVALALRRD